LYIFPFIKKNIITTERYQNTRKST